MTTVRVHSDSIEKKVLAFSEHNFIIYFWKHNENEINAKSYAWHKIIKIYADFEEELNDKGNIASIYRNTNEKKKNMNRCGRKKLLHKKKRRRGLL